MNHIHLHTNITTQILMITFAAFAFAETAEVACPEPVSPEQQLEFARDAFSRGEELFSERNYLEAANEFRCSYALVPHPNTAFNLAEALELGGNLRESIVAYQEFIENYPESEDRPEAESRIHRLGPLVPPEPDPPPDEQQDDQPDDQPDDPPTIERAEMHMTTGRHLAWATLTSGIVTTVLGAAFIGIASNRHDTYLEMLRTPANTLSDLENYRNQGQSIEISSYVLFGIGSALLLSSIVLFSTFDAKKPRDMEVSLTTSGTSFQIIGRF